MRIEDDALTFDPRTYTASPTELAGRIIAITGASGGMGRAVAIACAAHGAQVILIGRNTRKLEAVHAEIEASGAPEPIIALLDLEKALAADYDQIADCRARALWPAGWPAAQRRHSGSPRTDRAFRRADVVSRHAHQRHRGVRPTHVLVPALKRSQDASVIFTASSVGRRGRAFWGAYAVSKFAIEGLSQVLAAEMEGSSPVE